MADPNETREKLKSAVLALRKMKAKLTEKDRALNEPIAVIGIGCRFPGGSDSPAQFWDFLRTGGNAMRDTPPERWDTAAWFDPDQAPGKIYNTQGAFIDDVDCFDAAFFGISPAEAAGMDPQHRMVLEVAWHALEHAAILPQSLKNSPTGVFIGQMFADYQHLQIKTGDPQLINTFYATGTEYSFNPGRLSYLLGLQGPCLMLDTACSSGLVAVHLAAQSLRSQESNLALAGAVNLMLTPETTVSICSISALSKQGRCATFDAAGDGYARGEGCGILVLKRQSDAERDGDRILALIKGTAVNHDGAGGGLTVPSGPAQERLIRAALGRAGVDPTQIDVLEAHGTGTSLGDPIEVNAFSRVYCKDRHKDHPLIIGSVKSNIGHLEGAAGISGLIKLILALQHGQIPPNLHFQNPNPHIDWDRLPIQVPTQLLPWPDRDGGRMGAVSSFGLSGINGHAVLTAALPTEPGEPVSLTTPMALVFSAKTPESACRQAACYAALITKDQPCLRDLAWSSQRFRTSFPYRDFVVLEPGQNPATALTAKAKRDPEMTLAPDHLSKGPVFVYTGQGAQWVGMGAMMLRDSPHFRRELERVDKALANHQNWSVLDALTAAGDESQIHQTDVLQPVLFALQVALTQWLIHAGVKPHAVVGHSVGEVAAAHVAGVLSLEDAAKVIVHRGRLMHAATGQGKMAAVGCSEAEMRPLLVKHQNVGVAAVNSPNAVVVSGDAEALRQLLKTLPQNTFHKMLPVNYAFHSPMMAPAAKELTQILAGIATKQPTLHLVSTVSGGLVQTADYNAEYWGANITGAVRFADAVNSLIADGHMHFLEIGPHPALKTYLNQLLESADVNGFVLSTLRRDRDDRAAMVETVAGAWASGINVDWDALFDQPGKPIDLPCYPFERTRHWVDLPQVRAPQPLVSPTTGRFYAERWRPQSTTARANRGSLLLVGPDHPLTHALRDAAQAGEQAVTWVLDLDELAPVSLEATQTVLMVAVTPDEDQPPPVSELSLRVLTQAQLLKLLAEKTRGTQAKLWITSSYQDDSTPNLSALTASAALGFSRGLSLEAPQNWGGSIQLQGGEPAQNAAAVLAELSTANDEDQILYRNGVRHVKRLEPMVPSAAALSYDNDASYLITGGLGGIGLKLAAHMAAAGAGCLLLTGRSPLPDPHSWDDPDLADHTRARIDAVRDLRSLGARVEYMPADAADEDAVRRVFARFGDDLPPLRGIMHAGGVAKETPLHDLRDDQLAATLQPKVAGTWLLHQLAGDLDFFVCFSSISSIWGAPQLAHYAAANRFEDVFCTYRAALGQPALSINWGPWADGGMATPELAAKLARSGLKPLAPQTALHDMERLLATDVSGAVIVDLDWDTFKAGYEINNRRKLLSQIQTHTRPPETPPVAPIDVLSYLQQQLAAALGKSIDQVDPNQPLDALGLDSLLSVDLKAKIQKGLGVNLPVTAILSAENLNALAGLIELPRPQTTQSPKLPNRLAQLLADALGKSPQDIQNTASLPALGMDSLACVDLKAKIQKHLRVNLPVTALMEAETFADLLNKMPGSTPNLAKSTNHPQRNRWLVFPKPNPAAKARLFCFAYAGGGPGIYKSWPDHLPADFEVCAVQLQGRGARLGEPALKRMKAVAAGIVDGIQSYLDKPFAFFGHCMGAILMYEVTLELRRRGAALPVHFFPSGAPAPNLYIMPFVHNQPESSLLDLLQLINFSSTGALLEDQDMKAAMIPTLRADFEAVSYYPDEYQESEPLDIPMTGFGAWEDLFAAPLGIQDWNKFTTRPYPHHMIHGDHYFLETEKDFIFSHLIPDLTASLAGTLSREKDTHQAPPASADTALAEGSLTLANPAAVDDRWSTIIQANPNAKLRLICFPPAWTQADDFQNWPEALPSTVEVVRLNWPGRENRQEEPPHTQFEAWLEALTPAVLGLLDKPFAFFGHCIGAMLAYETARRLQTNHGVAPRHLFLSAAPSPRYYVLPLAHRQPDNKVLELLHLLKFDRATEWWQHNNAPPEVLTMLKADFEAMASYHYKPGPKITAPITNFATWDDLWVSPIGSLLWRQHTTGAFNQFMRDGHHFSLAADRRFIQQIIVQELLTYLR